MMLSLRLSVTLSLAGTLTAAMGQGVLRPCNSLPAAERESAQAIGACREGAPIVDVVPNGVQQTSPVVVLVPRVTGLSFDEARGRLTGFTVRRSYVASAEPGGTVLEQQPEPPARVAAGSVVRVVVSDGSLRPAPQVAATEIDGVRRPAAVPPVPAVSAQAEVPSSVPVTSAQGSAAQVPRSSASDATASRSRTDARKPTTGKSASASRGSSVRSDVSGRRAKPAPAPAQSARTKSAAAAAEMVELPNVIGRGSADASAALAEFKVERIEVVANAAPSGQVLAQDPAPGTLAPTGSAIGLQVSDGSLARASTFAPAVAPAATQTPARPAAPAPVRAPLTFPSTAVLLLIAGVLLGLGLGGMLMRRWLAKRHAADTDEFALPDAAPSVDHVILPHEAVVQKTVESAVMAVPATAAAITFAARLEEGETTIEFAAPSDADEMTLEYSRDLHE